MKKYISPEAQLLNFTLTGDVCDLSADSTSGNAAKAVTDYDDSNDEI